jgi:hypothetical protein
MNVILDPLQFQIHCAHFLDVKKNMIMEGNFTKLIYSDSCVTLNGIYIKFPIQYQCAEKIMNKNIAKFNSSQSSNYLFIKQLLLIEENLLEYYKQYFHCNKDSNLLLREQLNMGQLKLYKEYNSEDPKNTFTPIDPPTKSPKIMVKISGIWENKYQIGLTYKFIEIEDGWI